MPITTVDTQSSTHQTHLDRATLRELAPIGSWSSSSIFSPHDPQSYCWNFSCGKMRSDFRYELAKRYLIPVGDFSDFLHRY